MSDTANAHGGPDLVTGVPLSSVADGADFSLAYVGHAGRWDKAELDGEPAAERRSPCTITYSRAGKKLAVAVVHRDLVGLRAEVEFEQAIRDSPA